MNLKPILIFPVVLIILFTLLKWVDIELPHFWDESWSYAVSVQEMYKAGPTLLPGRVDVEFTRGHPLLYYFLTSGWMQLFGDSLLSKHLISLLYSSGLIVLFFWILNRAVGHWAAAFGTLVLMAQNIFFVQSSMLLPEVLVAFFSLGTLYFWTKEQKGIAIICMALAMLTKESAVTLPAALGVYILWEWWCTRNTLLFFKNGGRIALACLPVLLHFVIQKTTYGWFFFPEHVGYMDYKLSSITGKIMDCLLFVFWKHGRGWMWVLTFFVLLLQRIRQKSNIWGLLPLAVFLIGLALSNYFFPLEGYMLFLLIPGLCGTIGISFRGLCPLQRQQPFFIISLIFILLYLLFTGLNFFTLRYIMPVAVLAMLLWGWVSFSAWQLAPSKWGIALFVIVVALLQIRSVRKNEEAGDVHFGLRSFLLLKKNMIDYISQTHGTEKNIAVHNWHTNVELRKPECGFVTTADTFLQVQWEIDRNTQLILFESCGADPRRDEIARSDEFILDTLMQKGVHWLELYQRKGE